MFKDAAKGLCKQQSQDSASESITVNTTAKLEQVTACSVLKSSLVLRSGNCKLNEAEDQSIIFLDHTAILFVLWSLVALITPCSLSGPAVSSAMEQLLAAAPGGRSGAVGRAQSPQTLFMDHNMGGTAAGAAQSVHLSQT